MDSVVLCRSPRANGTLEESHPVSAASGCAVFHMTPTNSGGYGTSAELIWELIDIFESAMFAFPIYDHDSARDIVRYLLERGILEEEIADAIKDSAVDMNTWLEKGDKYMVGEWVIAWINACREDYVKQKTALGVGTAAGYPQRPRPRSLDGSVGSLGHQCGPMDDDDDDGDCAEWGGLREDKNEEDVGEGEICNYRAEIGSTSDSFRGVPSYSSGLSFGLGAANDSNGDMQTNNWAASSPSSPPTPFHRLAPFLRRTDHPGMSSGGLRRRAIWWKAMNTSSLQHLVQSADEKSDSGIVSDILDRTSHDDVDDDDDVDGEKDQEQKYEENCTVSHQTSMCSVFNTACGSHCSCKLPHYARFQTLLSKTERCINCGKEKETYPGCHPTIAAGNSSSEVSTAQVQGQYYKDFIIRALEYTLETLDREGPGFLFILTDSEDRPITWSHERRYRVASSHRPDLCVAAYRSRNLHVDLLWQVHVNHHSKMGADVQMFLERHRLHSNWFKCTLATVMDTVYAVISRYQATASCLDNEQ